MKRTDFTFDLPERLIARYPLARRTDSRSGKSNVKVVKKTPEYTIYQRGDERYAVKDANKKPVNGDEKVRILAEEGLLKVAVPAAPVVEEVAEEAAAEEATTEEPAAEEAPAEEPAAEEAAAEEPTAEEAAAEEPAAEEKEEK